MSNTAKILPTYCSECGLHVRNRTVAEDVCKKDGNTYLKDKDGKNCITKRTIGANSRASYKCKDFTEIPNDRAT